MDYKYLSVLSNKFREPGNGIHSKSKTFWLGGDSEEEIYKILKRKHKINKQDVEWIKQETPPFVGE